MSEETEVGTGDAVAGGPGMEPGVGDDAQLVEKGKAGSTAAKMPDLNNDPSPAPEDVKLDVILDIPVTIAMEIGRTNITIRNLLQLNQGSVVELDRLAGEPLDVMVNGTLIAHGEVVVVNEKYGIRLTDVISPAERVMKLK
ncbi:MAG: flagellar motor switch protein FliN [Gammaproteobacteria bacterium]|nr:flagellar motor switch protein FliN [Gammaproteobacteria bacterium]